MFISLLLCCNLVDINPVLTSILPPGGSEVIGLTTLNNELFVVRETAQQQIQVYDTTTFTLLRNISVTGLQYAWGLASCSVNNCLYVSNCNNKTVYRIELSANNSVSSWSVGSRPTGLFVNSSNNVIVTCYNDNKLQEFTTRGSLVREINYKNTGITGCCYALQLSNDQFVVSSCYNHIVFIINSNGDIVMKYDNSSNAQIHSPVGLVHLSNGCFLVACNSGSKVKILNSSLSLSRDLSLPVNCGIEWAWSLCYEESRGRLYVGEWIDDKSRVFVFDNIICSNVDFQF